MQRRTKHAASATFRLVGHAAQVSNKGYCPILAASATCLRTGWIYSIHFLSACTAQACMQARRRKLSQAGPHARPPTCPHMCARRRHVQRHARQATMFKGTGNELTGTKSHSQVARQPNRVAGSQTTQQMQTERQSQR